MGELNEGEPCTPAAGKALFSMDVQRDGRASIPPSHHTQLSKFQVG